MAKLPAKFQPEVLSEVGAWSPPQLGGDKVIRVNTPGKDKKISVRTLRANQSSQSEAPVQNPTANMAAVKTSEEVAPDSAPIETGVEAEVKPTPVEVKPEPAIDDQADQSERGYAEGFKKGEDEGFSQGEAAGYEAGLAAGTKAGREAAEVAFQKEVASQTALLNNLVQALNNVPQQDDTLEESLLPLVTQIVQVVLMGELKADPGHIRRLVKSALGALPHNTANPRAFINPSDVEWLQEAANPGLELVPDAALARGSCRIETNESQVDGNISTRILDALVAAWGSDDISAPDAQALQRIEERLEP